MIYNSASRIVFIFMAFSLTVLTMKGVVEAKDFVTLCSMAFTYYFARQAKNNPQDNELG